jgi:hypothetical protein
MSSAITSATSSTYSPPVAAQVKQTAVDSDGDRDGSKPGEIEKAETAKPVSATVGNNVNTTA